MTNNKNLFITIGITIFLLIFISFLLYVIYCYSYYDSYQKNNYLKEFNHNNYNFVYEKMVNNDKLSKEEFERVRDLMYDKNTLKNIYNLYYIKSDLFEDLNDFFNNYYYGEKKIDEDDIEFYIEGKSNLFNRSKLYYKKINLINRGGFKSALGILDNVIFEVEDNSKLIIDKNELECSDGLCSVQYMYMGLHEVYYESNGFSYYGLLNLMDNSKNINITNIDSLVKIEEKEKEPEEEIIPDAKLNRGVYKVNKCFLTKTNCAYSKYSYLALNEDGTCELYEYISFNQARYRYNGTYDISGNFLTLSFDGYLTTLSDYDTSEKYEEFINEDIEMIFKIEDSKNIINADYSFKFSK